VEDMVVAIFAGTQGYLDRIKTERVGEFQESLRARIHAEQDELRRRIRESGELSDDDEQALQTAVSEFLDDFGADFDEEGQPLETAPAAAIGSGQRGRSELERAVEEAKEAEAEADQEAGDAVAQERVEA